MIRFDKQQLTGAVRTVHCSQRVVRFQDVDAVGIVFFSRFFEYVHEAYEEFLAVAGLPLPEVIRKRAWAAPLRHVEADYLSPARLGDVLTIEIVAAWVEESEITLGFRLHRTPSRSDIVAVVQTVHTFVDVSDFKRCAVPEPIALLLAPLM